MTLLAGRGLHTGAPASVRLVRAPGAVRVVARARAGGAAGGAEACIAELVCDGAARSTTVTTRDRRLEIRTVEHLFAALGAMSIHDGVEIEIDGPELPLLDGGARAFFDALERLELAPSPPTLRVARAGTIDVGASRYEVRPPERPGEVRVDVEVDFSDVRLERHARWDGDAVDFRDRIAPARTFGFEHEIEALLARGLASFVTRESVVVIGREAIFSAGPPFHADEPARHKLLDLVGDLYAHGGPPLGALRAIRPGHAATHEAIRRALADGLLLRERAP